MFVQISILNPTIKRVITQLNNISLIIIKCLRQSQEQHKEALQKTLLGVCFVWSRLRSRTFLPSKKVFLKVSLFPSRQRPTCGPSYVNNITADNSSVNIIFSVGKALWIAGKEG